MHFLFFAQYDALRQTEAVTVKIQEIAIFWRSHVEHRLLQLDKVASFSPFFPSTEAMAHFDVPMLNIECTCIFKQLNPRTRLREG